MARIRVNGVEYAYERQGSGQLLVLLHGFTGSADNWTTITDLLNPAFETLAIDLLGHGRTESPGAWSRYAMVNVAGDVMAIIDRLEVAPSNLLGYSMGGRVALILANNNPDAFTSLILESASPGIADPDERESRRDRDENLADTIESNGIQDFVDHWERLPLFASQKQAASAKRMMLRQQRLQNNAKGLANSLRGMGAGRQPSLWESLPSIQLPSLLLCGAVDEKYVRISRAMAEQMPTAELTIVPETGHNIHFEQPEQFAVIVTDFIAKKGTISPAQY